jgi:transcriptional regulator with XRE-family HTH domain
VARPPGDAPERVSGRDGRLPCLALLSLLATGELGDEALGGVAQLGDRRHDGVVDGEGGSSEDVDAAHDGAGVAEQRRSALDAVPFPERLVALRKQRHLSQQGLADRAEMHVVQIRRYEGGRSEPTLDALHRLALALSVSADMLVFEEGERGSEGLRLDLEAASQLDPGEQRLVRELIDGPLLKREVRRLAAKG